jgi:hypothetical protein
MVKQSPRRLVFGGFRLNLNAVVDHTIGLTD